MLAKPAVPAKDSAELPSPAEPPSIEVLIRDQGRGIPKAMQSTLFEPFTSSKGHEGLGLSIVHSIVKETGGKLSYQTGNKGTTFLVQLPI